MAIREPLAEETKTVEAFDDLAVSYYKMALAVPEQEVSYLKKALALWTELAERFPENPSFTKRRDIVRRAAVGKTEKPSFGKR